jgi:NADPH:quinone reductase-like Zn-dependent oxidoreductase
MRLKRIAKWGAGALSLLLVVGALLAYWTSDNDCGEPVTAAPRDPMRAVVYCEYGSPDVLALKNLEKPVPGDSQVLVRVRAAAVNPLDWHYMRGSPYVARLAMGVRKPKVTRMGVDFAGTVEAVGKDVTRFRVGDRVFGGRTGAFAQYVTIGENRAVVRMPANVTFEQAAAVPVAALTALQAVRDQARIRPGQRVLVNGASGGVGTFAVQIAKALGAHVTGVCSTRNVEMVRSIGADRVIDYTREDFTRGAERYDVVIDNVGNHSLSDLRGVLKREGKYVMVGGPSGGWIDPFPRVLQAVLISSFASQDMRFFVSELNQKDLTVLRDLMEAGKVTPVIDRRYPLSEIEAAVGYLETGRARGKVIVTMD